MSLFTKISLFVLVYTFISFVVIGCVNLFLLKDFMNNYKAMNNQNIGIYFQANYHNENSIEKLRDVANIYFQRGGLTSLKLFDESGKMVLAKAIKSQNNSSLLRLIGEKSIETTVKFSSNPKNKMRVEVVSSYKKLNNYIQELIFGSLIVFFVFTLLLLLFLKIYTKSLITYLQEIKKKIYDVSNNDFLQITAKNSTKEFSDLRDSVNDLADSMKKVFDKEKETDKKYYELLYKDTATKLFNRKYFMSKISQYIGKGAKSNEGVFVIFSFGGIDIAKDKLGFLNLEKFLVEIAKSLNEIVEEFQDTIVSRMNDSDFSIIIPNNDFDVINPYLEKFFRFIRRLFKENKLDNHEISFSAGAIKYNQDDNVGSLFSKTDYALSHGKVQGRHSLYFLEEDDNMLILGKEQWRELLNRSLKENTLLLYSQDIMQGTKTYLKEILVRLEYNEKIYSSEIFLPVLANFNLRKDIDKFILIKFFDYITTTTSEDNFAIKVSAAFIIDTLMISWFKSVFKKGIVNEERVIVFESTDLDVINNLELYGEFVELLQYRGFFFAIDNYKIRNEDFEYLRTLRPKYIKISKEAVLIQTYEEERIFQKLLLFLQEVGIELIVTEVDREKDIKQLNSMGIYTIHGKQTSSIVRLDN